MRCTSVGEIADPQSVQFLFRHAATLRVSGHSKILSAKLQQRKTGCQCPWLLTRGGRLFFLQKSSAFDPNHWHLDRPQARRRRSSGSRSPGGHGPGPLPSVPKLRKRPSSSLLVVAGSYFLKPTLSSSFPQPHACFRAP